MRCWQLLGAMLNISCGFAIRNLAGASMKFSRVVLIEGPAMTLTLSLSSRKPAVSRVMFEKKPGCAIPWP